METLTKCRVLSGNVLKLIACVAMVIDHVGVMFFPYEDSLRIIGRLAFPIFAFMIAEGARYTRNRLRYFLTIFIEGVLMQLVYTLFLNDTQLSIFITFSISIPLIYALDLMKRAFILAKPMKERLISVLLFALGAVAAYFLCEFFEVDYGFLGVMTPVVTSTFMQRGGVPESARRYDLTVIHVLLCGVVLLLLALEVRWVQLWSLLALPLLLLYSGKRGRLKLKYFFYVFYPVHLVVIAGVAMLLQML